MTDTPLIFTKLGNLPIADLKHQVLWHVTEDYIKLVEIYTLDGEIVKESVHVRTLKALPLDITAGGLN